MILAKVDMCVVIYYCYDYYYEQKRGRSPRDSRRRRSPTSSPEGRSARGLDRASTRPRPSVVYRRPGEVAARGAQQGLERAMRADIVALLRRLGDLQDVAVGHEQHGDIAPLNRALGGQI